MLHTVTKMAGENKNGKEWNSFYVSVPLAEGTSAEYKDGCLTVKGPKGEVSKRLKFPGVNVQVNDNEVSIGSDKVSRTERAISLTYRAHVTNMIKGVTEGFEYKLAVVYAKFPVSVEVNGNVFRIKNFLGEKVPRTLTIPEGVTIEAGEKDIVVKGIDKELVGQVAGNLEELTSVNHLDRRVVQDGIFITEKPHKKYV